ncbi:MAG: hypothetical protein K6E33_01790, partial [Lachnospiraceae bacterium]|nr:hypothetical protein [Lachnospiraceae bacterium]
SSEEDYMDEFVDMKDGPVSNEASTGSEKTSGDLPIAEIKGIDTEIAIRNSGSEEAFKMVLKIFYDSIKGKYEDLEKCYSSGDWENYTIKIHALKSSARLVGAVDLGDSAEKLEMAGKGDNIQYIKENHEFVMEEYLSYVEALAPLYEPESTDDENSGKPMADEFIMESMYEEVRNAAENMDSDTIDSIMEEMDDYAIPASEKEKYEKIREMANLFDFDGIIEAIGKG